MDYKKEYKILVEAIKKLQETNPSVEGIQNWINDNVPELRESEDEEIMEYLISFIKMESGVNLSPDDAGKILAWIEKQGEQKPAWSEEEEEMIQALNTCIDTAIKSGMNYYISFDSKSILIEKVKNWLKSIKDRVQPQNNIVTDKELAQAKKEAYNEALDKIEYHSGEPTFDDGWSAAIWYLKKINGRPQNGWKPSDVQMQVLKDACDKSWEPDGLDPLYTLYEDLEKLKGE